VVMMRLQQEVSRDQYRDCQQPGVSIAGMVRLGDDRAIVIRAILIVGIVGGVLVVMIVITVSAIIVIDGIVVGGVVIMVVCVVVGVVTILRVPYIVAIEVALIILRAAEVAIPVRVVIER